MSKPFQLLMQNLIKLQSIIKTKKTNICLSADLTDISSLVKIVDQVGPHVCAVKLHSDIIQGLNNYTMSTITKLAERHNFMIIDDRKFCDIGNTVELQSGPITEYADFITVHSIPGPGILDGLRSNCTKNECGILLIAQMSTDKNLIESVYTRRTIEMALSNLDIVSGFICQERLVEHETPLLHFTPGCQLEAASDQLGQKYNTPESLLQGEKGVDILIVGRGIYAAENPLETVQEYQRRGWEQIKGKGFESSQSDKE